jgi:hypothetical protein
VIADGYAGNVTIRYLGVGGQWCFYDVSLWDVAKKISTMVGEGADEGKVILNEGAPDESIEIQGELWNGMDRPYWFWFSRVKTKMRTALHSQSEISEGLKSLNMLRSVMTPSSWADFEVLLERYPDHAIEVSVYSRCLGDIPGRNALVWEVRRY